MSEIISPVAGRVAAAVRRTPAPVILELDVTTPLLDDRPRDPVSAVRARRRTALRTVIDNLHEAATDERVQGLITKVGAKVSLAQAQELRDAVRDFRRSGKPAYAWAETFGEFGPGSVGYVLATGYGQIWLQPSGDLWLTGAALEGTFLREALDRAGIDPQLSRRHEYKNAADQLLQRGYTDAHREASARLAESAYEQLVAAVADGRQLSPERVRELVDSAPLPAQQALDAGLVDRLGYRDEVYAALRERVTGSGGREPELLFIGRYHRRADPRRLARRAIHRRTGVVALVQGTGAIHLGHSGGNPISGPSIGSDTIAAALRAAVRDDAVKAIVFRVNSPGGSYVASDVIWREVGQARRCGKPVVVSMGDVAGSGGYFVSMAADAIVAEPATLTGSIGVYGGKLVVNGLLDRLGVGHDGVAAGRHARMNSARQHYTDEEWHRLEESLDRIYDDFVAKAAEGRGMSRDRMHEIARGRVWTGADARERGLVDELGGLRTAAREARKRAGLPPDAPLRPYPHVPPVRRIRPPRSSEDPAAAAVTVGGATGGAAAGILRHEAWGELAGIAAALGLPPGGPLLMPTLRLG